MTIFRCGTIILWFLFCVFGLQAQSKRAEKVLQAESRRFEAMTKADTQVLSPMLAGKLHYVHSNALRENKAEHLNAIATKKLVYQSMERETATVHQYGRTAIVNGVVRVKGVLAGNAFEVRLLYLAVYRKIRGQWQLLNWQSTRIP